MKKILLEKLLDNCKEQEYQKQYEYIINLLEEKKIKPVKASRLNGKSPALYREYWLLELSLIHIWTLPTNSRV